MIKRVTTTACCLIACGAAERLWSQPIPWQGGGVDNNWTTPENWDHPVNGALPTGGSGLNETALIGNGDTAVVDSDLSAIATPPDGPPGELTVSNGSTLELVGAGRFLTESGTTADGSVGFTSGGVLSTIGPSVSFEASALSFSGGGVFAPTFTSAAAHEVVSVPGAIDLQGGTLRPVFDFVPTGGLSYVVASAADISGDFALDLTGANLPAGLSLGASITPGPGSLDNLVINLTSPLLLTVNTDDGTALISNPAGGGVEIIGYGIASELGQLAPTAWQSLADQSVPGWGEAGLPSVSQLDELAGPSGPTTQGSQLVDASGVMIGAPFTVPDFQSEQSPDLTFEYVTKSGELVQGNVVYEGLNTVNNLLLTVDPSSGQAELINSSQTTLSLRGYSVLSASGALQPDDGDWNSLDDQAVTGVEEAGPDATDLSELIPLEEDALELAPGAKFMLGELFDTAGSQDLTLEFLIEATSAAVGDYNDDGSVDAADYTVWRDSLGSSADALENRDPANTGLVSVDDYLSWRDNFGAEGQTQLTVLDGDVIYEAIAGLAFGAPSAPEPNAVAACLPLAIAWAFAAGRVRPRRVDNTAPR